MLDSDEVYQMTKRGLDAAQIAAAKGIHLNLVLVKLLELHHLGLLTSKLEVQRELQIL